ncbi:MAG: PspC domain-containing protein [Gemmatimonadota bacterium]|nr:PspC domain-containing protein [Gemmatimonadota bacterium]
MSERKLYKSSTDKMIGGVCGGLGQHFNIDPTVLRIAWVGIALLTMKVGMVIGGLAYLASYLIIPQNPDEAGLVETENLSMDDEEYEEPFRDIQSNNMVWGIVLVLLALVVLTNSNFSSWRIPVSILPAVIIGGLIYCIIKYRPLLMDVLKGLTHRRLYRLTDDKKILGVCAGLADSFQVDPTLMRLGWVLVTILTAGPGILIYLVMAFIMPVGRPETAHEST